jgi:drug/metabolite transporter (DMT)-like permease
MQRSEPSEPFLVSSSRNVATQNACSVAVQTPSSTSNSKVVLISTSSEAESASQPAMVPHSRPAFRLIVLGLVTIYLVWGSTYLAIRVGIDTIPPFLMASTRFLVAGFLLAAILVSLKRFRITGRQCVDNFATGGLLLLGGNGLVSWAQQEVPSGMTTLILSLNPLLIVIADWLVLILFKDQKRGAKPNAWTFIGLALGFVGMAVLIFPSLMATDATHLSFYHVMGLIAACVFWCIGSLYTRYSKDPADPMSGSAVQMIFGGLWLLLVSLLMGEPSGFDPLQVSQASFWAWVYLMTAGSLIAFTTFVWLTKHASPSLVATYSYVNPVVAVFLGWYFLNETVSPRIFLGGVIAIAGVAIISMARTIKRI